MSGHLARLIAFYLPQFHPIPENDVWWGKGFTEWTNVAKAKPMFRGHYQPRIPADLGFYDLRVPETREAQAEMAREHGIEGFCYWHYWFAGKRLLERPFNEVLASGKPDFPFCLGWANQTWTGIWHGEPYRILVEQTYPGSEDAKDHFYAVLDAFTDERYMTIDGKPVFVIQDTKGLPQSHRFTDYWRELAVDAGLKGIYFVGMTQARNRSEGQAMDAVLFHPLWKACRHPDPAWRRRRDRVSTLLFRRTWKELYRAALSRPEVYPYSRVVENSFPAVSQDRGAYDCVYPNWDNTPRSGANGVVLHGSTPELFGRYLKKAIARVDERKPDERVVFIKSWNEWAEGNYLEPDRRFGRAYLEATRDAVIRPSGAVMSARIDD